MRRAGLRALAVLLVLRTPLAFSAPYPVIGSLDPTDALFAQLQNDIASFHRANARGERPPSVSFFAYRPKRDEDLFAVAARVNTGIQSIATVNRLSSPDTFASRDEIVIPSVPGLYIPEAPGNDLEYMLSATYAAELSSADRVVVYAPRATRFRVLPGREFTGIDTAFFLGMLFRFPLPSGTISSWFGPRPDPFTGNIRFHNGLDIAAPEGTDVYASRAGTVVEAGEDPSLGLHCVIEHPSGYRTVYGHLSRLTVELSQKVKSGSLIGAVGSTGHSTGPHLHFEIRTTGGARDPALFVQMPNADE